MQRSISEFGGSSKLKTKLLLLIFVAIFAVAAVAQTNQEPNITVDIIGARDQAYTNYAYSLNQAMISVLKREGVAVGFDWKITFNHVGQEKVSITVECAKMPARYPVHADPYTKVVKLGEDPLSAMKPVANYIVQMPKILNQTYDQKY